MKKKYLIISVALIISVVIVLNYCSAVDYTYDKGSPDQKFTITVPAGWTSDDSGKTRVPLALIGPKEMKIPGYTDSCTNITINIITEKMPEWYRIDDKTLEALKDKISQEHMEKIKAIAWFKIDDKNMAGFKDKIPPEKFSKIDSIKNMIFTKEELIKKLEELSFNTAEIDAVMATAMSQIKVIIKKEDFVNKLKGLNFKQKDIDIIVPLCRVEAITPVEYVFTAFNHRTDILKSAKAISETEKTINGIAAYQAVVDYEFTIPGQTFASRTLQTCILNKGSAYIITGSANEDNFSKFEETFRTVSDSFKVN
ncbi:MAG: hypothetical protein ABRQ37_05710 [Candidatus Eremiobacterota bacterium]